MPSEKRGGGEQTRLARADDRAAPEAGRISGGSASKAWRSRDERELRLEQGTVNPRMAANGFQGRWRYVDVGCGDLVSILPQRRPYESYGTSISRNDVFEHPGWHDAEIARDTVGNAKFLAAKDQMGHHIAPSDTINVAIAAEAGSLPDLATRT
jgi:hypothetical protein